MIVTCANRNDDNDKQPKQNHKSAMSSTEFLTKRVRKDDDRSMRSKRSSEKNKVTTNKRDVVG